MKEVAPFQLDVLLDAKADVAEADSGDGLWIEGWASDFEVDRQDEAFEPNAFTKAIAQYLKNPVLLYHHMSDKAVGQVKDLKLVDGQGMYVKAWLDKPADGTEDANIYNKVKSKTIRAFSVGGVFRRKMTPRGPRIHEVDLREISITPLPVNPRSLFELAGKAFGNDAADEEAFAALAALSTALDNFEGKAYDAGMLSRERPTINTPGDIAKAVDRATGGVEEEEALREYLIREAESLDCMVLIPEEWLLEGKAVSADKRRNAKYHFPGTDKYPIDNKADLENAISRSGSSTESKSAVRAYLIRVAKELGCSNVIPEDWLK